MSQKIGLIAAGGRLPFLVAGKAVERGDRVFVAALRGGAAEDLESLAEVFQWVGIAQVGRMIDFFREHGVKEVIFAGTVNKTDVYSPTRFLRHPPDMRSMSLWRRLPDKKDSTILRAVAEEFAGEGIEIVSCLKYLKGNLTPAGALTKRAPDERERADIEFGWKIARTMAGMDVGQSIVVKNKAVVAVEAMEGTDETIRRGGKIAHGGAVLIKFSRPAQDPRFDIPAAGPETVKACAEAHLRVISLEAERTLLFDKDEMIDLANKEKIAICGVSSAQDGASMTQREAPDSKPDINPKSKIQNPKSKESP